MLLKQTEILPWSPDLEKIEIDSIEMESHKVIEDAKRQAFSELNQLLGKYGNFSKDALNGRILLLTGDVIRDRMEIAVALEYLKNPSDTQICMGLGEMLSLMSRLFTTLILTCVSCTRCHVAHVSCRTLFRKARRLFCRGGRLLVTNISQYWT